MEEREHAEVHRFCRGPQPLRLCLCLTCLVLNPSKASGNILCWSPISIPGPGVQSSRCRLSSCPSCKKLCSNLRRLGKLATSRSLPQPPATSRNLQPWNAEGEGKANRAEVATASTALDVLGVFTGEASVTAGIGEAPRSRERRTPIRFLESRSRSRGRAAVVIR